MLEKDNPEISLKVQADLLGMSYSSLFYESVPPCARELAIKRRIDKIYTDCPFYGSRKIAFLLRPEFGVSRPTVQAYMREMGISAVVPGPNTSKSAPQHPIYPYLLRNATAERPNHIWGIDITYIRCGMAGCISQRFWTGIPAMSSVGRSAKPWKWTLCSRPWTMPCFKIGRSR